MSGDTSNLEKDPQFQCGVALSVYQNSGGDPYSNWANFEKQKMVAFDVKLSLSTGDTSGLNPANHDGTTAHSSWKKLGKSVIKNGEMIGVSSDFWNNYESDIQLAKDLGSNSFRLSIEWSRIVPKQGHVEQSAIDRYHQMFDCMDRLGLEPNVTLHWFVHPQWFDDLGGWIEAKNIRHFVEWAELAFKHFGKRSKLWATFNEPGVHALCAFIAGNHPPGKLMHFRDAGLALMHMLRAHAGAYRAIESLPGGKDVAVGLVHNVFWTEPKGTGIAYAHVRAFCRAGNRVWGNETVMRYLQEGVFHHWLSPTRHLHWRDPMGKPGCDWFGINHYASPFVVNMYDCSDVNPKRDEHEGVFDAFCKRMLLLGYSGAELPAQQQRPLGVTEMGYPMYPPSLYRAISYASKLGVPMYITENGCPYLKDDSERTDWINGYLTEVQKAVKAGYDVRGFMYWTLIDNWEWAFAYELKFGLYEFDPSQGDSTNRRLKAGAKVIKEWYADMPERLGKELAKQRKNNVQKSEADKQEEDNSREEKFLKKEGLSDDAIEEAVHDADYEQDPVTAGQD